MNKNESYGYLCEDNGLQKVGEVFLGVILVGWILLFIAGLHVAITMLFIPVLFHLITAGFIIGLAKAFLTLVLLTVLTIAVALS